MNIVPIGFFPFVLIGLIVGWFVGFLIKRGGYGLLGDILLGIVGAIIGGFLVGAAVGIPDPFTSITPLSIGLAIVGAAVTVAIVRTATHKRHIQTR